MEGWFDRKRGTLHSPDTDTIRKLHDAFRRSLAGGCVVKTDGIAALPEMDQVEIILRIRMFDDFNKPSDPYGEHDFGSLYASGNKVFFEIEYFDKDLNFGSENPTDPEMTTRIMTVMLANEYCTLVIFLNFFDTAAVFFTHLIVGSFQV
jgi:hypothetical protein